MKIGLFCNDKEDIDKLKLFATNKITKNKEEIIQIKKPCDYGFDIVTDKNEYIIRNAQENSRGFKLHEVYHYNITNKDMLNILYFTLIPFDWNDREWRAKKHFINISEEELKWI